VSDLIFACPELTDRELINCWCIKIS